MRLMMTTLAVDRIWKIAKTVLTDIRFREGRSSRSLGVVFSLMPPSLFSAVLLSR